jgi:hypothetical protein
MTTLSVIGWIRYYVQQINLKKNEHNFDRICDTIFRLIEKLIFKCKGSVPKAKKKLEAEGLEDYLELYLDFAL